MNTKVKVTLNDFSKIKKFSSEVIKFESDIDLIKNRYVVNAKSTMGIFTLDLSESIDVVIQSESEEEIKRFNEVMKEFM
jgi:phosphotransferase system HPr-like phosphotransfer protein